MIGQPSITSKAMIGYQVKAGPAPGRVNCVNLDEVNIFSIKRVRSTSK